MSKNSKTKFAVLLMAIVIPLAVLIVIFFPYRITGRNFDEVRMLQTKERISQWRQLLDLSQGGGGDFIGNLSVPRENSEAMNRKLANLIVERLTPDEVASEKCVQEDEQGFILKDAWGHPMNVGVKVTGEGRPAILIWSVGLNSIDEKGLGDDISSD